MIKRNELKEFNIETKKDVKDFVNYLVKDLKCSFNPDDSFSEIVNLKTGESTFDQEAADYLDEVSAKCFDVADDDFYVYCLSALSSLINKTIDEVK